MAEPRLGLTDGLGGSSTGRLVSRKQALWTERSSYDSHWREIARFQQPRLGRFLLTDKDDGRKKHGSVIDNTAIRAADTLAAGMLSGVTSPARPWLRLGLQDRDRAQFGPVKTWLHLATNLMLMVFGKSNTYRALHACYHELGLFGTWAAPVAPSFENVIHLYPLTIGEYAIATDNEGRVDTLFREYQCTVAQLVGQFGKDAVSLTVRNLFDRGTFDAKVDVIHAIYPREHRDPLKQDAINMPYASVYIEVGHNEDRPLRVSGFEHFPALTPRWTVTSSNTYGDSPGMEALGDSKQLQHAQLKKGKAIDLKVDPPVQAPASLKAKGLNQLPGGVTYYDMGSASGGPTIRPLFEVQLDLQHQLMDIQDIRERIRDAYYADLFLMIANDTRPGRATATEIAERHEEKMLMLGPVLERLHNELLQPLIDITFDRMIRTGMLPPPPPELEGQELDVEFISVLAQAQRIITGNSVDRLVGNLANMAAVWPDALDKLDVDQTIDDYADMYGVNPEIIVPTDVAIERRQQRAQQMAAQQAMAAAQPMAQTAKTLGETDAANANRVVSSLSGYGT